MAKSICTITGCAKPMNGRGYCTTHYARWRKHGDPMVVHTPGRQAIPRLCSVSGCDRACKAKGYCGMHWRRVKRLGHPDADRPSQKATRVVNGWTVRGSGHTTVHGYRFLKVSGHPNAYGTGLIPEHRFVMACHLSRSLFDDEVVHHKNGDKLDNRIENLELMTQYHGKGQGVTDRIADAIFILERYAPEMLAQHDVQLRVVA